MVFGGDGDFGGGDHDRHQVSVAYEALLALHCLLAGWKDTVPLGLARSSYSFLKLRVESIQIETNRTKLVARLSV